MDLRDRYRGTLVGVHVGDSQGIRFEGCKQHDIARDIAERGGLVMIDFVEPWNRKNPNATPGLAGRPSDDAGLTADLAYSLLACNGFNHDHFRESMRETIVHHRSRLWDGYAIGVGEDTTLWKTLNGTPEQVREALANNIGTNGSLMRCAPMGLWWFQELSSKGMAPTRIRKNVYEMSAVTHTHNHAKQACWWYTLTLAGLLYGQPPSRAIWAPEVKDPGLTGTGLYRRIDAALTDSDLFPVDPGAWPARGTAEFSLYVALYSLLNSSSFAEGIEMAIRVGGDTDTYAAIAGGLLSAHYGYSGIPEEWRQVILGHDAMVDFADQLYERIVASQPIATVT